MIDFGAIPGTEVISINSEPDGLLVKLRSTLTPPLVCPYCGAERVRNGTRNMTFRDVPQSEKPTMIEWRRQKFLCPRCSRSSHDGHPAFDQRHAVTKRFIEWVSDKGRKVTFSSLSKLSGVNEKVVRQIFGTSREAPNETHQTEILGIELIKVAGGLHPAFIDIGNRSIIDVFSSERALLDELALLSAGNALPSPSITVCDIELVGGIQSWFSRTTHLISRTSLHRYAVATIEAEVKPLLKELSAREQKKVAPDLALFRKRKSELGSTAKGRLGRWRDRAPRLPHIYYLKEDFLDAWNFSGNPTEEDWELWQRRTVDLGLDLNKFILHIETNMKEIKDYPFSSVSGLGYPSILAKTQTIDKARTHSFSASRTILLENQGKKA